MAAPDEPKIIGSQEAAEILGWDRRKVQRAVNTGQIPVVGKLGPQGKLMFDAAVIEEIAHHEHPA